MTQYGTGFITICDTVTGDPSGPGAGDSLLLWAEEWRVREGNIIKPKQTVDGEAYTASKGKKAISISIRKAYIYDDDGNQSTNTQALNNKLNYLREHSELSGSPIFIIITSDVDSVNVDLSGKYNAALDYCKGYVKDIEYWAEGGHYMLNLSFVRSTIL